MKGRSRQISNLLKMDLARATLVLIRVLRTLINSIAKNLHKLQICLRFYSFYKKLDIQAIIKKTVYGGISTPAIYCAVLERF